MGLDLRLPLGLMFLVMGLILLGYGLLTWGSGEYVLSLGINVNVAWGVAMLVAGGAIFLLGWRARGRDVPSNVAHNSEPGRRSLH